MPGELPREMPREMARKMPMRATTTILIFESPGFSEFPEYPEFPERFTKNIKLHPFFSLYNPDIVVEKKLG